MAVLKTDHDLTTRDLAGLTSADALQAFLSRLGYDTSGRTVLTPASLGLSGDTASAFRSIEPLSEDANWSSNSVWRSWSRTPTASRRKSVPCCKRPGRCAIRSTC